MLILALNMMASNSKRAERKPRYAMIGMIIPSVTNVLATIVTAYFLNREIKTDLLPREQKISETQLKD